MQIETIAISALMPDPQNARRHNKKNIDVIANSLREFGQRKPIVATHDGIVIAGNGTLEAAQELGWTEITVARAPEDWDEAKIRAYALADNQSAALAEWDEAVLNETLFDLADEGWNIEELGFEAIKEPEVLSIEEAFDSLPDGERPDATQMTFVLSLEQGEVVKEALAIAKRLEGYDLDTGNTNSNGNALAVIAEKFVRVER